MSKDEKIYYEKGDVIVTASRVVLGDKNFVLRNISAVQVISDEVGSLWYCWLGAVLFGVLGIGNLQDTPILSMLMFLFVIGFVSAALLLKDSHYVEVSSGGTPTNTIKSNTKDFPQEIVDAINNALLDLDKNRTPEGSSDDTASSNSSTDEILKLKNLLDAGALTQEEFDAKKKELLGL